MTGAFAISIKNVIVLKEKQILNKRELVAILEKIKRVE
jgi:hypothetical protein